MHLSFIYHVKNVSKDLEHKVPSLLQHAIKNHFN